MNAKLLFVLLLGSSLAGRAQAQAPAQAPKIQTQKTQVQTTIYGTWQVGSAKMEEGLLENYEFKVDNTFEYHTDSEDGLRRVIALGGTYTYAPGKLQLVVTYAKELVGGTFERSTVTHANDTWAIEGGTVQQHKLPKPLTQDLEVHFNNGGVLAIGENRFFRVK